MKNLKVIKLEYDIVTFENGVQLYSDHRQSCCESHYLSFDDLNLSDFENLEFDLSDDNFFRRVEGYGIELIPINGFPIRVPGYASNNGYYSSEMRLCISTSPPREYDISECQDY